MISPKMKVFGMAGVWLAFAISAIAAADSACQPININ